MTLFQHFRGLRASSRKPIFLFRPYPTETNKMTKRRDFLRQAGLLAAGTFVSGSAEALPAQIKPVVLKSGQDRGGMRHFMGLGALGLDAKISTADSQGALFLWEVNVSEKSGPPRHIHTNEDEWFYVVEGEFVAELDGTPHFLGPGDSMILPRGVPHAYAHISDGPGKMIAALFPAGSHESFLEEARLAGSTITPEQTEELFRKHGMKMVGPPIDVSKLNRPG